MKSILKPGHYIKKQNYRIGATIILFFVAFLFLLSCTNNKSKKRKAQPVPPNVLFIAVDDVNKWLGCMNGHPNTITPNIDKLASQGVLFTNAHCQAPLCGPSRASLMTGLRPSTTWIYGMIDNNKIRNDNEVTKDIIYLPEYFKNNGYHTMGIGKLFHTHSPEGVFDELGGRYKGLGPLPKERFVWDGYGSSDREKYGRTSTDWGAFPEADSLMPDHQSADWTIERLNRDYNKPFFLAVGMLRPLGEKLPTNFVGVGENMADVWMGSKRNRETSLYWECCYRVFGHRVNRCPMIAMREGEYKLLMHPDKSRIELYNLI